MTPTPLDRLAIDQGGRFEVRCGNAEKLAHEIWPGSVQVCMGSPPYFHQRDYGFPDQIGLEQWTDETGRVWADLDRYIRRLVAVYRGVGIALARDGVLWVNIGDKFNFSGGAGGDYNKGGSREGQRKFGACRVKGELPKSLLMVPERFAMAMRSAGFYLRAEVIWEKTSMAPTGVSDRPLINHEKLYMFTTSPHYFWDMDAVRTITGREATPEEWEAAKGTNRGADRDRLGKGYLKQSKALTHPLGRALRTVWKLPTSRKQRGHYSAYPEALCSLPILSSSRPGDLVLDVWSGTGTTGEAALRCGRRYLGIEGDPDQAARSRENLAAVPVHELATIPRGQLRVFEGAP